MIDRWLLFRNHYSSDAVVWHTQCWKIVDQEFYTQQSYPSNSRNKLRYCKFVTSKPATKEIPSGQSERIQNHNSSPHEEIKNSDRGNYVGSIKDYVNVFLFITLILLI